MMRCIKNWRVLVLLVLSVLLPWRSAMANTMLVAAAQAPLQGVLSPMDTTAHPQAGPVASDCPHHSGMASPMAMPLDHETADPGVHDSHSLCDVCNGPALGPVSVQRLSPHGSPVGPADGPVRFASLVLPTVQKPPIPV